MSAPQQSSDAPVSKFGRAILLGTAMFFTGVFLVASQVSPDPRGYGTHQQLGLPPCTFRLMFGYHCPGCGMTTSFAHFVRGDLASAARANLAGTVLAAISAMMIPWCVLSFFAGRMWFVSDPVMVGLGLTISIGVLAVLLWVVRIIGAFGH